jgi:negative regulator of flagellin synthesis FlgM
VFKQYQSVDNFAVSSDKQAINATVKQEEKVDLSTKAKDIQQAKNALIKLPDVRKEKVQEIKTQGEKGIYNVNAEKIAGKMVKESIVDIFARKRLEFYSSLPISKMEIFYRGEG